MKKTVGIVATLIMGVALFFNAAAVNNEKGEIDLASLLTINSANAECEVEVKIGFFWKTVLTCDSTPNRTCSFEQDGVSFTCSGKKTYQYGG